MYMSDVKRLRDYDRLTTALHSVYKKSIKDGWDWQVSEDLGRAYKDSVDIRKHGGKVELNRGLIPLIREKVLHEYFIPK